MSFHHQFPTGAYTVSVMLTPGVWINREELALNIDDAADELSEACKSFRFSYPQAVAVHKDGADVTATIMGVLVHRMNSRGRDRAFVEMDADDPIRVYVENYRRADWFDNWCDLERIGRHALAEALPLGALEVQ